MGGVSSKSKATLTQATTNTAQNNSLQGYDNQTATNNLSGIGGGALSTTNLSLQTTDFGAVAGGLDLSKMSIQQATDMALNANKTMQDTLTKYFDQGAQLQSNAQEIASTAAGASWRDKGLIAAAMLAIVLIVIKGKK